MRSRDVRAITFCAVTAVLILVATLAILGNPVVALALTVAYSAVILTRPRMLRIYRRMQPDTTWGGYYDG